MGVGLYFGYFKINTIYPKIFCGKVEKLGNFNIFLNGIKNQSVATEEETMNQIVQGGRIIAA